MNRLVTITDLTRMSHGFVCVAGRAEDGEWVRLAWPRLHERELAAGGRPAVYPTAVIECDLRENRPAPPHTEDYAFDPRTLAFQWRLEPAVWHAMLEATCYPSVEAIFEQTIHDDHGWYIADGRGPRSLGTLRPQGMCRLTYSAGPDGAWGYRLAFYDGAGARYRLKITDYTWHRYCEARRAEHPEAAALSEALTGQLNAPGRLVYLRIGLSRGWREFPGRCYLQVNGVYTVPDCLEGRTFAELA